MRVLVCGGRDFTNFAALSTALDELHAAHGFTAVIEGDARGADRLSARWARSRRIQVLPFRAAWSDLSAPGAVIRVNRRRQRYNAAAGYDRNLRMLVEGKPDLVVAFPGGKGTANMMRQARDAGVPVAEVACGMAPE